MEVQRNMLFHNKNLAFEQNYYKPRTYRQKARKEYLNLAKCKKPTGKKIRKAIKSQLQYIRRDLRYIDAFLEEIDLCDALSKQPASIRTLVDQQQYMYDNNDRIEVEQTLNTC